jgi:alpha-D-xyloside xylohydrolase
MKKILSILLLTVLTLTATATDVKTKKGIVTVTFLQPDIVRVLKTTDGKQPPKSLVVTLQPQPCRVSVASADGQTTLKSSALTVAIDEQTGRVTFTSNDGRQLLKEGDWQLTPLTTPLDKGCVRAKANFQLDPDEPIYGIGLMENYKMNQRGEHRRMMQSNLEDFQNIFQSLKGYALYWDNYSPTQLDDTPQDGLTLDSEVADGIDYYFMYGRSADGNVALIRQLSGDVPMLPLWSYGFWQSRERYQSREELTEVVDKYRQLGVPLDGIIMDWQYWDSNYLWNAMEFLNPKFPNAKDMIDYVHQQKCHFAISIWQSFGPQTKGYRQLKDRDLLFDFETWPQSGLSAWPPNKEYPSGVRVYKPYTAEARDIYWQNLRRLYDLGCDVWWMDSTDPDHSDYKESDLDVSAIGGSEELRVKSEEFATAVPSFRKLRNAFPLECVRGVYENQRKTQEQDSPHSSLLSPLSSKRVMILTRSGFAGQQRYAANVWTGDVRSDWPTLRNQIPMLLNYSLTGNPHCNTDIGGFFSGAYNRSYGDCASGAQNPQFQELYVRWMQFGAFCPMMRSHGTETYRELYYFGQAGEPVYDALLSAIKLRYRLLPYIYSTAWDVTHNRGTFMRALWMDYADDPRTHDMKHEFLFGRNLLVAPIVNAQYTQEKVMKFDEMSGWDKKDGADNSQFDNFTNSQFLQPKSHTVYLPAGKWFDYFSGRAYDGGQEVTLPTTLHTIPLFVRAGSIIPIGGDLYSTADRDWSKLSLHVYPGADGTFTLYEDDGETYGYEQGQYTEIPMTWNDRSRTLTIGKRQGGFAGAFQQRQFTVVMPDGTQKTVDYRGKTLKVKL